MRKRANLLLLMCLAALYGPTHAFGAPVPVPFGQNISRLQDLVDRRYGKNHIDVTRDYIGARAADIDPWFWVSDRIVNARVRMLRRNASYDLVGWYTEDGNRPPGGGGVLFGGPVRPHEEAVVTMPTSRMCFGFYVDAVVTRNGSPVPGPGTNGTKRFFTNRKLNDCGPNGTGAFHAPFDGDVQALVFDVSRWAGPGTWLVCFEDRDTGGTLSSSDDEGGDDDSDDGDDDGGGDDRKTGATFGTPKEDDADDDNGHGHRSASGYDYYDVVFEVMADGATPARTLTFGGLKLHYR